MTEPRAEVTSIVESTVGPRLRTGYLVEDYDGIGQVVYITLSWGSSSAIIATVSTGAMGAEQELPIPAGTAIMVLEESGHFQVVSLSGNLTAGSVSSVNIVDGGISGEELVAPRTLPGTALIDGTLEKAQFAESLRPPTLWTSDPLPTLPSTEFPIGSLVFWETDGKLYRNKVDVWTVEIDVTDLNGLITGDKIAANAITAGHIEAGAIGTDALAAQIILGDHLITTGLSGARVEIDDNGIRNIDAAEKTLVNIPTDGSPVSVVGEIEASSLTSLSGAELRGTNTLPGNSVTTLETGISNPVSAPTIYSFLGSRTLTTAPAYVGHGLCYDSSGYGGVATFLVGANPTTGNLLDMAYEYNASTGALVRTIRKTGTTQTLTGTAGSTSHIGDTAEARDDVATSNIATPISMPAYTNMKITKVSVYIAGFGGTETCRVCVWNDVSGDGNCLGESASFSVGSRTFTAGNAVQYNKSLSSPVSVSPGTIYAGWRRTGNGPGFWWDRDDGSSRTTYAGAGYTADGTGWGVWNSASKPNVYVTFTYDVDGSEEGTTGKIIGVARAGSYIWCLDANGVLFKYNQSDADYLGKVDLSAYIAGTKANAGLFYDGTYLIICTATGVTGTDQVRFVKANATTGAWVSTHATTGYAINGSTATVRGGYSGTYYWVSINGSGRPYNKSTYAYVANAEFGESTSLSSGLTFDGTYLRGWSSASYPTLIWQFSNWDWTTESALYWVSYTWYKSTATTRETMVSPRASITLGRRRYLSVSTPAIPTGAGEVPDRCRVYMERGASDPGGTNYHLQVTDALTARTLSTFASAGAANPSSNSFPAGTAAELKSSVAGWSLKGDGTKTGFYKYVGLSSTINVVNQETYTASDSTVQTTAEITGLPSSGVVAVQAVLIVTSDSQSNANYVMAQNWGMGVGNYAFICYGGAVAGAYASVAGIVTTGGTNNRQVQYQRYRGAGTCSWWLRITGYWTTVS